MTDEAALLKAVGEAPADDLPRLVYADWLDERNDEGSRLRAAYIRFASQTVATRPPQDEYDERLSDLFAALVNGGHLWEPPGWGSRTFQHGNVVRFGFADRLGLELTYERGFVRTARGDLRALLTYLPRLLVREPVARPKVTDRRPVVTEGVPMVYWPCTALKRDEWRNEGPSFAGHDLPRGVFEALPGDALQMTYMAFKHYESVEEADDALAVALLTLASDRGAVPGPGKPGTRAFKQEGE